MNRLLSHPKTLTSGMLILLALFFVSCGVPDLSDPKILESAREEAIPLNTLDRKLMYGMIQLYVDQEDEPFSGWVRQINDKEKNYECLGYLRKGQKNGIWLEWYENGTLRSKIYWQQDRYEGEFKIWHPNGRIKVIGQTTDGEVDGKWKSFYSSGLPSSETLSKVGLAVSGKVWTPDGKVCRQTNLKDGTGILCEYNEDGSILKVRQFIEGIGTELEI